MYKIGLFSKMNRVTVKTLRYYDEIGLLKPAYIDDFTSYRYYTTDQLPVLHQILTLRQMGFTIEEITDIRKGLSLEKLLYNKKEQLLQTIAEDTRKLAQVEHYLNAENGGFLMNYNVIIKELPEVIVASMRRIVSSYNDFFTILPSMGDEMGRLGCICAVPEYCFNIYHDGEYKEENIDVEICEAVVEAKENSTMVKFKHIASVPQAACVLHKGPYSTLGNAYGAVFKWMEDNGYELSGHPRESYIDGIWNKETEDDWLTEVQFPLNQKYMI
jgi:DNA-binding transcriptional MerR regulator